MSLLNRSYTENRTVPSLILRGRGAGGGLPESSVSVPRSDVRGPVVTPIETAVTPFTREALPGMIADYEGGASLISIAKAHRLGKAAVSRSLSEAGVRIRRQSIDTDQVAQVVGAYLEGRTVREIAADLGVGHSTVWRVVKASGVELRPNARRVGRRSQ
ncbi:helix-turn-helix domain-containing protein [Microbacterium sp.]|uniref:helix-turn-helix domain-containing protein n=1 Tax=Microbacterium sp. TaxID=51671 RepID=UPI003C781465